MSSIPVDRVPAVEDLDESVSSLTDSSDAAQTIRNAGSLGSSVLVTAFIGLAVQQLYSWRLGPARFGQVGRGETLAILLLGVFTFGVDTYARKEVAVKPSEAQRFVPGVAAYRMLATAAITSIASIVLFVLGSPSRIIAIFALFGLARYLLQTNELLMACMQAVGRVEGLPRMNFTAKVVWAAFVLGGVFAGGGPLIVPAGWIVGELVRLVMLIPRTRLLFGLTRTIDWQHSRKVLLASLPFTASTIVATWSQYFDSTLIGFWFSDKEVGYYRQSQSIAGVAFLAGTVLPWTLMPLAARAKERSEESLTMVIRRSMQMVLTLAIPITLMISLHADTIISLNKKFTPAIPSLRILALAVLATYVIMAAMTLITVTGRAWLTVRAGLYGVILNIIANLILLRVWKDRFGPGQAGTTAAAIAVAAEVFVAIFMLVVLGRRAWDRRSAIGIGAVLASGLVVFGVDRILAAKGFSWVRLVADGVLYAGLLLLTGAVKVREIKEFVFQKKGFV